VDTLRKGRAMDLARYVVEAVLVEGRSYREVARAHGVSKSWVGKAVGRFRRAATMRSRHAPGLQAISPSHAGRGRGADRGAPRRACRRRL